MKLPVLGYLLNKKSGVKFVGKLTSAKFFVSDFLCHKIAVEPDLEPLV